MRVNSLILIIDGLRKEQIPFFTLKHWWNIFVQVDEDIFQMSLKSHQTTGFFCNLHEGSQKQSNFCDPSFLLREKQSC